MSTGRPVPNTAHGLSLTQHTASTQTNTPGCSLPSKQAPCWVHSGICRVRKETVVGSIGRGIFTRHPRGFPFNWECVSRFPTTQEEEKCSRFLLLPQNLLVTSLNHPGKHPFVNTSNSQRPMSFQPELLRRLHGRLHNRPRPRTPPALGEHLPITTLPQQPLTRITAPRLLSPRGG